MGGLNDPNIKTEHYSKLRLELKDAGYTEFPCGPIDFGSFSIKSIFAKGTVKKMSTHFKCHERDLIDALELGISTIACQSMPDGKLKSFTKSLVDNLEYFTSDIILELKTKDGSVLSLNAVITLACLAGTAVVRSIDVY